ncbi:MAG: hemin receptor [Cyclobacteriaceae bacterium]
MTESQIELVQTTYKKVDAISEVAAGIFYTKLFELDPSLKETIFKETDIKAQGVKLMSMIKAAVVGLNNIEKLVPVLHSLSERHVGYGVKTEHYATVGSALIFTLSQGLGEDFTDEVKEAWLACYSLLSETMKKAA